MSKRRKNWHKVGLHRLLELLEIAVGPPRRVVIFLELDKRLVSELVLFCAGQ
ncbi:MAG: hypothetical protein ABIU05_09660 [Nitrospirales bacterium]